MKDTQETRNALSTLGVSYEECGGFLYDFTFEGEWYDCEMKLVWCGLFGFSRTGIPQIELVNIYQVLDACHRGEALKDEQQIYAYLLHRFEFTDYGFSIFTQELTDKGKALYHLFNIGVLDYIEEYRKPKFFI